MVYLVNGDVLKCKQKYVAHQVNCQGVMGAGLAKQIKEKYPIVYKEYKRLCDSKKSKLGLVQGVTTNDGKIIFNIFGQDRYGRGSRQTNYNALMRGISNILLNVDGDIAIPHGIGCGLAGGDWNKVYNMITILSEDFNYDIYIYKI